MIGGFDELVVACVDEDAKAHIREAIRCYEASAYRASITATYVAVCFDLIAKLRSLSAGGDANAALLVAELERLQTQQAQGQQSAITGLLSFERRLLEQFRDNFEFFGAQEFDELERLRADRNRCAHPTFFNNSVPYAPSAELARLHIRNALTYVLSQLPKQGKAALANLQSTVLSPYFPDKLPDVVERLRSSEIGTARDGLIKAFVDDLGFGWASKTSPFLGKESVILALNAVIEIQRPVALPRLAHVIDKLAKNPDPFVTLYTGALALRIPEAGEMVSEATQIVLKSWLAKEASEDKGNAVARALKIGWWRELAQAVIPSLTPKQIGKIKNAPPEVASQAARVYVTAKSWDQANALAADCALPFAHRFTIDDIALIFSKATSGEADLLGSHSFREFINALYSENPISEDDLENLLIGHGLERYIRPSDVLPF